MSACPYRYAEDCGTCRLALPDGGCTLRWVEEHEGGATLEEVAAVFGSSRQAAEQCVRKALMKLEAWHGRRLQEYR